MPSPNHLLQKFNELFWTAGSLSEDDLRVAKERGINSAVYLCYGDEPSFDEMQNKKVDRNKILYRHMPTRLGVDLGSKLGVASGDFDFDFIERKLHEIEKVPKPCLFFCSNGQRSFLYAVLASYHMGVISEDEAQEYAQLLNPSLRNFVSSYIPSHPVGTSAKHYESPVMTKQESPAAATAAATSPVYELDREKELEIQVEGLRRQQAGEKLAPKVVASHFDREGDVPSLS